MQLSSHISDSILTILNPHAEGLNTAIENIRLEKSKDKRDYLGKYKKSIVEIRAELKAQNEKINQINSKVRELIDAEPLIKNTFVKVSSAKIVTENEAIMLRRISNQYDATDSEIKLLETTGRSCYERTKAFISTVIEMFEIEECVVLDNNVKTHFDYALWSCMPTYNGNEFKLKFENLAKKLLHQLPYNCSEQSEIQMESMIKFVEWFIGKK